MRTFRSALKSLFVSLALITAIVRACLAAESDLLDRPLSSLWAVRGQEIMELCRQLSVPCGIEEVDENKFDEGVKEEIALSSTTPREVLDQFVARNPSYSWQYVDGLISVRYKAGVPEASPLEKKIKHLAIKDRLSVHALKDVLDRAGIKAGLSMSGDPRYGLVTADFKDTSVRDALDQIARIDGKVAWHFTSSLSGKRHRYALMSWHTDDGIPLFNWRQRKKIERKLK